MFSILHVNAPVPSQRRTSTLKPMSAYDIRPIAASDTRPLRAAILRPGSAPETLIYPGDDEADALHVGAFVGERLVGIASVSHRPPPGESDPGAWQLRGMATTQDMRGTGCGAALVHACIAHVKAHGGTRFWCNARLTAEGFYAKLGLVRCSEEFVTPDTGVPHVVMFLDV